VPFADTLDAGPGNCDISAPMDVGVDERTPFAKEKLFRASLLAQM
jgi:hypothetical protein